MTARIVEGRDPGNPQLEVIVDANLYGFSLRAFTERDQKWLLDVLPRQMQEIHDRAYKKGKTEVQKAITEALGL